MENICYKCLENVENETIYALDICERRHRLCKLCLIAASHDAYIGLYYYDSYDVFNAKGLFCKVHNYHGRYYVAVEDGVEYKLDRNFFSLMSNVLVNAKYGWISLNEKGREKLIETMMKKYCFPEGVCTGCCGDIIGESYRWNGCHASHVYCSDCIDSLVDCRHENKKRSYCLKSPIVSVIKDGRQISTVLKKIEYYSYYWLDGELDICLNCLCDISGYSYGLPGCYTEHVYCRFCITSNCATSRKCVTGDGCRNTKICVIKEKTVVSTWKRDRIALGRFPQDATMRTYRLNRCISCKIDLRRYSFGIAGCCQRHVYCVNCMISNCLRGSKCDFDCESNDTIRKMHPNEATEEVRKEDLTLGHELSSYRGKKYIQRFHYVTIDGYIYDNYKSNGVCY